MPRETPRKNAKEFQDLKSYTAVRELTEGEMNVLILLNDGPLRVNQIPYPARYIQSLHGMGLAELASPITPTLPYYGDTTSWKITDAGRSRL